MIDNITLAARRDEVRFRTAVPAQKGELTILQVGPFQPGGPSELPGAVVLTKCGTEYTTHVLYRDEDRSEHEWVLFGGHYHALRRDAEADFLVRCYPKVEAALDLRERLGNLAVELSGDEARVRARIDEAEWSEVDVANESAANTLSTCARRIRQLLER